MRCLNKNVAHYSLGGFRRRASVWWSQWLVACLEAGQQHRDEVRRVLCACALALCPTPNHLLFSTNSTFFTIYYTLFVFIILYLLFYFFQFSSFIYYLKVIIFFLAPSCGPLRVHGSQFEIHISKKKKKKNGCLFDIFYLFLYHGSVKGTIDVLDM